METKLRENLQHGIYRVINPAVKGLIKIGLTPNAVTTIGLLLNILVAIVFVMGAEKSNRGDMSYIGWGGALVLFAGLFDMLDGQVARLGNMSTKFGALYDSVLDRYSEMVMFLGICYYLVAHHYFLSSLFAFIALIGSMMVSYTRARAEALGVECKGGLMQRPERVVTIGVFGIACGVTGHFLGGNYKIFLPGIPIHIFETMTVFTFPIFVMALLTNLTAINRLKQAKKGLERMDELFPVVKEKAAMVTGIFLLLTSLSVTPVFAQDTDPSPLVFPIPKNISNQLFYLQRDPNTNTIIYQLNLDTNGKLNSKNPINVFWIRYGDKGEKKELSYIQRKFAYGVNCKKVAENQYEIKLVSRKDFVMFLEKSPSDGKFYVYGNVNSRKLKIERIFLRIDGGTMWSPNVKYVEILGYQEDNPSSPLTERIKI